ncbi:MAG: UDP-glucose 4-epimerase, partial [Phycisphaerales bacterium]|nr:UDP-glucose 4-epimerase [Phycisphaerales bacterium]
QHPINPYGNAKLAFEMALMDYRAKREIEQRPFACAILRYFNVAGSDPGGLVGEDHNPETHLIPIILQAALGKRDGVTIFGTDYPTPDGTCIRDYIHVQDLVAAHAVVMEALRDHELRTYNLGIGKGLSVREIIDAARQVTGVDFAVREGARRPGDPPVLYADPSRVRSETD